MTMRVMKPRKKTITGADPLVLGTPANYRTGAPPPSFSLGGGPGGSSIPSTWMASGPVIGNTYGGMATTVPDTVKATDYNERKKAKMAAEGIAATDVIASNIGKAIQNKDGQVVGGTTDYTGATTKTSGGTDPLETAKAAEARGTYDPATLRDGATYNPATLRDGATYDPIDLTKSDFVSGDNNVLNSLDADTQAGVENTIRDMVTGDIYDPIRSSQMEALSTYERGRRAATAQGINRAGLANQGLGVQSAQGSENALGSNRFGVLSDLAVGENQARMQGVNTAMNLGQANEGVRRFDETTKEGIRRFDAGFKKDQNQFGANFEEGQRRFDSNFEEGQAQFGANFGEDQRRFDLNRLDNKEREALNTAIQFGSDSDVIAAAKSAFGIDLDPASVEEFRGYTRQNMQNTVDAGRISNKTNAEALRMLRRGDAGGAFSSYVQRSPDLKGATVEQIANDQGAMQFGQALWESQGGEGEVDPSWVKQQIDRANDPRINNSIVMTNEAIDEAVAAGSIEPEQAELMKKVLNNPVEAGKFFEEIVNDGDSGTGGGADEVTPTTSLTGSEGLTEAGKKLKGVAESIQSNGGIGTTPPFNESAIVPLENGKFAYGGKTYDSRQAVIDERSGKRFEYNGEYFATEAEALEAAGASGFKSLDDFRKAVSEAESAPPERVDTPELRLASDLFRQGTSDSIRAMDSEAVEALVGELDRIKDNPLAAKNSLIGDYVGDIDTDLKSGIGDLGLDLIHPVDDLEKLVTTYKKGNGQRKKSSDAGAFLNKYKGKVILYDGEYLLVQGWGPSAGLIFQNLSTGQTKTIKNR